MGEDLKDRVRQLGPWMIYISGFGEMLPYESNRLTLSDTETDKWGLPIPHIDVEFGDNERTMVSQIFEDGKAMVEAARGIVVSQATEPGKPGLGIHEMGTARMGTDPSSSVLNKWNQCHDVPNLFITDGAAMASSGCRTPRSPTWLYRPARQMLQRACCGKEQFRQTVCRARSHPEFCITFRSTFLPTSAAGQTLPLRGRLLDRVGLLRLSKYGKHFFFELPDLPSACRGRTET